jgi:DNA polymerase elongation subunit (family B)
VLHALLEADLASPLVEASHAYLAGHWLFSDPAAAAMTAQRSRAALEGVVNELRAGGCRVVEIDGEHVLFATPPDWTVTAEGERMAAAQRSLPNGVRFEIEQRYQAVYARAAQNTILLGYDGTVTLRGPMFRPGRLERFGEAFIGAAALHLLVGDAVALRREFLHVLDLLRRAEVPLEELCVQVTLHKSPADYRRFGTREEPYEVLLAAGVRSWRVGQRIRYFRAHGGEPRLLSEGDTTPATEADIDYYVQRLRTFYCQQLAHAFRRDDFVRIFRPPDGIEPGDDAELSSIKPVAQPV